MSKPKAIIAISGGVDSSVSAYLLKDKYDLIGVYMKLVDDQDKGESAARQVCRELGIKFYAINVKQKFKEEIIDYFLESYNQGQTPNPCVKCNKTIKFGVLLDLARDLKTDYLATGHYIKKVKENGKFKLLRGEDTNKDQSYFLYNFTQKTLTKTIFPLGDYTKDKIKKIAKDLNLPCQKGESQDICFLNKDGKIIDHNDFLKKHIIMKSGPIKTLDEKVIGEHHGLQLYTIGQRRGVEIGGIGPFYVARMDYDTNTLYVTNNQSDEALHRKSFQITKTNWISGNEPKFPYLCEAVIRYRHKPINCTITKTNNTLEVELAENTRAVTAGQSVVFYQGNELLGGAIIS